MTGQELLQFIEQEMEPVTTAAEAAGYEFRIALSYDFDEEIDFQDMDSDDVDLMLIKKYDMLPDISLAAEWVSDNELALYEEVSFPDLDSSQENVALVIYEWEASVWPLLEVLQDFSIDLTSAVQRFYDGR